MDQDPLRAASLIGVFDSREWNSAVKYHMFHFVFLVVEANTLRIHKTEEALDIQFYGGEVLPSLSPGHDLRVPFLFDLLDKIGWDCRLCGTPPTPFLPAWPLRMRRRSTYTASCRPQLIENALERHLPVHVWTVDEERDMRDMVRMGVHSITTHRPGCLVRLLQGFADRLNR